MVRNAQEGKPAVFLLESCYVHGISYFDANSVIPRRSVNYARWLTIHFRDMMTEGNFVVHKSERAFSGLAIDQAHEQNNAVIKEDESALRRWMVAGPEVSRLVADYESKSDQRDQTEIANITMIHKVVKSSSYKE
eukprot:gene9828-18401_t